MFRATITVQGLDLSLRHTVEADTPPLALSLALSALTAKDGWPRSPHGDHQPALQDQADLDMVALALAELAVARPGWRDTLQRIATLQARRDQFEAFVDLARDRVPLPTRRDPVIAGKLGSHVSSVSAAQRLIGLTCGHTVVIGVAKALPNVGDEFECGACQGTARPSAEVS